MITHNTDWLYAPDHPFRILIIGGSGLGKTNASLNLISHQPDVDKIYIYPKDLYEAKYQFLIQKCKIGGLKNYIYPEAFVEYSNYMQVV